MKEKLSAKSDKYQTRKVWGNSREFPSDLCCASAHKSGWGKLRQNVNWRLQPRAFAADLKLPGWAYLVPYSQLRSYVEFVLFPVKVEQSAMSLR
jgi:hypothetical protein